MNKVITIGREFGSGGRELGHKLSKELGYAYYDGEILTQIIERTELSEDYVKNIVEGHRHYMFPITIGHTLSYNYNYDYNIKGLQDIYKAQTEVIKNMANLSDCVIVGRCADYILHDQEDVELFRIFVYARMDSRIKRCIARAEEGENLTPNEMQKFIKRMDRMRAGYYEDYTLQKWGDKINYDLCINTSYIVIDNIVPQIAKLFE